MSTTSIPTGRSRPQTGLRSLPLLASLAGLYAALGTLAAAMAIGMVGWFVTDGGVHGVPRDALRSGALGWLLAHGSGVVVDGVRITAVPLGFTLICAWVVWRSGMRLGESLAGHGPNAEALADGDRDWTVPVATGLFAAGYVVVATLTGVLAATADTDPALGSTVGWALALTVGLGGPGIAIGSGRAAVWLPALPDSLRVSVRTAAGVLVWLLGLSTLVFVAALAVDLGAAANVLSQMHTDTGDALIFVLLMVLLVPNAVVFAGSYLLGPGFLVGTATLVSPTVVAIGPVPLLPLLAALPDNGPTPFWTPYLIGVPVLAAAVGAFRTHRKQPTAAWDQGALRGVVGGALAGLLFGFFAALAGGAAGPGRMADVGPVVSEVVLAGIVSLGLGGLFGGLLATWLFRRALPAPASYVGAGRPPLERD